MKVITIIVGILLLLAGIFFLFTPGLTFLSVGWLLGVALLISGISVIADYATLRKTGMFNGMDLFLGVITAILGVLLLINQPLRFITDVFAVYLLGAWILISGIIRVVEAIQMSRVPGSGWGWTLVLGFLMIALGVYSFFHPLVSAFAIAWLIAFYVILAGIDMIVLGSSLRKAKDPSGEEHWTIAN